MSIRISKSGTKRRYVRTSKKVKDKRNKVLYANQKMQSQNDQPVNLGIVIDDGPGDGQPYTLTGLRWHVDLACSSADYRDKWNLGYVMDSYDWDVTWAIVKLQKNQDIQKVVAEWPRGDDIYDPDTNMICWGTTKMKADFDGKAVPEHSFREWDDHTKSMRIMQAHEKLAIIWRIVRGQHTNKCWPKNADDPGAANYELVFNTKIVLQSFRMSTR